MPRRKPSRADRNISWIEQHLRVPEGRDVGKPIKLRPWQKDVLRGIYDTPTRRAIISFARKAGKTSLCAMILCLHICGPEARPNSQLFSSALSREQAGITFMLACKMLRQNFDLLRYVQIRETAKQIACPELGTLYRALSAEASTAYGLSPVLVIHDELGQTRGPRSELYEALETASAAHVDPLSIIISTQASSDGDLLSILIDDAAKGEDPRTKLFLWTAPEHLDPFSDEALRAANPAAGDFANLDELRGLAADAKRMPSREAEYRQLLLNQRVEAISPFISKTVWDLNGGDVLASFVGRPVFAGLDLSETSDLTAFVMVSQVDDLWHVKPIFWLPGAGLPERSRRDRTPYDLWARQGFLETTPGASIEYRDVAKQLFEMCQVLDMRAIAFDRWGMKHLSPWLLEAGFDELTIEAKFKPFGQGFASMSPALRSTESLLLNNRVRHQAHPVLTMCAANGVVEMDPSGNRKLTKKRSRGRIDGLVAMCMALAIAETELAPRPFKSIYDDEELAEAMAA